MRIEQVKEIANAVLYEGYLLYPYRQSAIKNRQRWTIGVVYPREYSEANGDIDPWFMQTECLLTGQKSLDIAFDLHIRFLHLLLRTAVPSVTAAAQTQPGGAESLAGRMIYEACEEGIEREIHIANIALHDLVAHPRVVAIAFPGQCTVEDAIAREQRPISGTVRLSAELVDDAIFKLRVQIENTTPETRIFVDRHNEILQQAFVSTHTILQAQQGEFISLLEPPDALQSIAQECLNLRTWPVFVGEVGETDVLLSSPIILYDYPQIAPESPGSLFDGTEIDEILTLRILTLTEDEKEQMRQGDERVREILERTEALTPKQFMKLHGTIRSLRPIDEGEGI
jgi:hypothetical protein